jgi:S-adenosylmethionine hydrolase
MVLLIRAFNPLLGGEMRSPCRILGLLTDFGSADPYVAAMKGVALSVCRSLSLVDVSHEIAPYDITQGSFILLSIYKYFPEGTVFVSVVDPGVGSSRRPIAIATRNYYFVGPDNGLLIPAAVDDGIERAIVLNREEFFMKPVSSSFHGRDIFAPVAARVACGTDFSVLGDPVDPESLAKPVIRFGMEVSGSCVKVWVVHIDRFGNIVLSERFSKIIEALGVDIGSRVRVKTSRHDTVAIVEKVFSVTPPGTLVLYGNSLGYGELAVNMGSASKTLDVSQREELILCRH